MSPQAILFFCAQALLAQSVFSHCGCGGAAGYNGLAGGYGAGYGAGYGGGCGGVASTGGGLAASSASCNAPVGVSVRSENAYEGRLAAGGNLPFLGTVAIEGVLPTAGAGAVSYGCGDGAVGIFSEGPIATGIASPGNYAPSAALAGYGNAGYGYAGNGFIGNAGYGLAGNAGYGFGGHGCGCGAIY